MYLPPTNSTQYGAVNGGNSVAQAGSVTDSSATGSELAGQLLGYVGYLASLINEYAQNGTGQPLASQISAEIKRVVGIIESQMGNVTDPAALSLLNQVMSQNGLDLKDLILEPSGGVNPTVAANFLYYWMNGTAPGLPGTFPISSDILNWLSTSGFNLKNATDPDTMFAYLMGMNALVMSSQTSSAASQDFETFLGTMDGDVPASVNAAIFLSSYIQLNGLLGNVVAGTFTNTGPDRPNYNGFCGDFTQPGDAFYWGSFDGSQGDMQAGMDAIEQGLPN